MRRKVLMAVGSILTLAVTIALVSEAWARCPPGTAYNCYTNFQGKVVCGCR